MPIPEIETTSWRRIHRIESTADLLGAIVGAEAAGAIGMAHMLRAFRASRVAFLPLLPDTPSRTFKAFAAKTKRRPAVMLIGDDDYQNRGPDGWTQTARAVKWARAVVLHGAAAKLEHYEAAFEPVQRRGTRALCGMQWRDTTCLDAPDR